MLNSTRVIPKLEDNKSLVNELADLKLKSIHKKLQDMIDKDTFYLPDLNSLNKFVNKSVEELEQIIGVAAR